nr:DUF4129 domain-containing protein [Actinomycetales bacterium]
MWHSFALPALVSEIPVDPSAAEAREWAREELARPVYSPDNLFTRIGDWILNVLGSLFGGQLGSSSPLVSVLLLVLVVALAIVTVIFAGRVRRVRNVTSQPGSHLLFDDARPASELRRDARAALARGDLTTAFLDAYRAIIRSLDERVLIDDRPGLTAQEAAHLAKVPFPAYASTWEWAARLFDAVCYGRATPEAADVQHLIQFDTEVDSAVPAASAVIGASTAGTAVDA